MKVLITGGAGFIGVNAAQHYLQGGHDVCVLDNLQRKGADVNLKWLQTNYDVDFALVDVRKYADLRAAVDRFSPDFVVHLAAQVAVTTSVENPREDFEINALGTFNLLEALRSLGALVPVVYASTNKVYGRMEAVKVVEHDTRYEYAPPLTGVSEDTPLDFHSPYGCSKGAADQYMRDYHRIFGIPTVVLRQSCIYGEHQFGVEDQGWVAWFTIATLLGYPMTIYGDGKQVRDVLYIKDLIQVFDLIYEHIQTTAGQVYNIGGGPAQALSLLELLSMLSDIHGKSIPIRHDDWRPGDQLVYISDIAKVRRDLEWAPEVPVNEGLTRLYQWVDANKSVLRELLT